MTKKAIIKKRIVLLDTDRFPGESKSRLGIEHIPMPMVTCCPRDLEKKLEFAVPLKPPNKFPDRADFSLDVCLEGRREIKLRS